MILHKSIYKSAQKLCVKNYLLHVKITHCPQSEQNSMENSKQTEEIKEIVDRETRAWDTQDTELLVSVFHPDMVWPFPPTADAHDPMEWIFFMGRFNKERWKKIWQNLFDTHRLAHNKRVIKKILLTEEQDGALAIVDIDTLWLDAEGNKNQWKGRVCKVYSKVNNEWKMTMQTGVLNY